MRILHALSQIEPTGTEFYLSTLVKEQRAAGHEVFIVSDKLHTEIPGTVFSLRLHNRDPLSRIRNVSGLRTIIKENKIDVVHAHSRASSWASHHAVSRTSAAFVSTVHGRQHIHNSSRGKAIYGSLTAVICENLKTHLSNELLLYPGSIEVIPNPFQIPSSIPSKLEDKKFESLKIGVIGRASGPKGERCTQFLNEVLPQLIQLTERPIEIYLAGFEMERAGDELRRSIQAWKSSSQVRVEVLGFLKDLDPLWSQIHVLVAAGRTLVEGLMTGLPCIALGESSYEGPVSLESYNKVIKSNFGDIGSQAMEFEWSPEQVAKDVLHQWSLKQSSPALIEKVIERFSSGKVAKEIERLYQRAIIKKRFPNPIPSLMYHRVVEAGFKSDHKTYVFEKELRNQLQWLKKKGFTTLTFKDFYDFESGKRPLSEFPKKPIFLSFDDGYKNNHTRLLPLLKEFGFKITLFCLSGDLLKDNSWDTSKDPNEPKHELMNLEELKDFVNIGCEIGSHGFSHSNFTEISQSEVEKELQSSKDYFEKALGQEVISFAYPFGRSNETVKELTKKSGYLFGISTDTGGLHLVDDPYEIFRVNVFPEDLGLRFQKKTSPSYRYRFWKTRGR